MAKTLKSKDETITIRVKKVTKERIMALYSRMATTATKASFMGDLVLLGLQVKEIAYKQEVTAIKTMADTITPEQEKGDKAKRKVVNM